MSNCVVVSEEVPYEYSMLAQVNKLWTFNKKTAADLLKTVVKVEGITLTARDFKFIDDNWSPTDMELMCTATPGKEREKGMVKKGYLNDQVWNLLPRLTLYGVYE